MQTKNFIVCDWMVSEKGLTGNALLCYAFLYTLTQHQGTLYCGSYDDIANAIGCTRIVVYNIVKRLVEQGLVIETRDPKGNVTSMFVSRVKVTQEEAKTKTLSKQIDRESSEHFEECWKLYQRKGSKKVAKSQWDKLTPEERGKVKKHIAYYLSAVEVRKYQKDFERYLRDRVFNSPVYQNGRLVYDPETDNDTGYHPYGNTSIIWDDINKRYIIMSPPEWGVADGYTDDNRPKNAELWYQNMPYVWNSQIKSWYKK